MPENSQADSAEGTGMIPIPDRTHPTLTLEGWDAPDENLRIDKNEPEAELSRHR